MSVGKIPRFQRLLESKFIEQGDLKYFIIDLQKIVWANWSLLITINISQYISKFNQFICIGQLLLSENYIMGQLKI